MAGGTPEDRRARAGLGSGSVRAKGGGAKWQTATIPEGSDRSNPLDVSPDLISAPPGQVRTVDGGRLKGRDRPKMWVEEDPSDAARSVVVLDRPAEQDLVVRYKAEDDD